MLHARKKTHRRFLVSYKHNISTTFYFRPVSEKNTIWIDDFAPFVVSPKKKSKKINWLGGFYLVGQKVELFYSLRASNSDRSAQSS